MENTDWVLLPYYCSWVIIWCGREGLLVLRLWEVGFENCEKRGFYMGSSYCVSFVLLLKSEPKLGKVHIMDV